MTRFFDFSVFWRVLVFLLIFSTQLQSQPISGTTGITLSLSRGFVPTQNIQTNVGSMNIGLAYMPSERIAIHGGIGFLSQQDTADMKNSEFTFKGGLWYYLQTSESVSTFLGGSLSFGSATDASGRGTSIMGYEGFFGAEYWFSKHFSWYGHIGVVYTSYTVAEKKGSDIFTAGTIGVNWYF